jgi:hypothetical protein
VGTGQSDLTWATQARVGYRFDKLDVYAGYRYMFWNFDSGTAFDDLRINGPVIGGRYRF